MLSVELPERRVEQAGIFQFYSSEYVDIVTAVRSYGNNEDKSSSDRNHEWHFIPSYEEFLLNFLRCISDHSPRLLHRKTKPLVLDIGCGVSPILLYLRKFLPNVFQLAGIDNEKKYLDAPCYASQFDVSCHRGNLLNLSSDIASLINKADFIYSYFPIKDVQLYVQMIQSVFDQMKPNAMIYDPYGPIDEALINPEQIHTSGSGRYYVK